MPDGCIPALTPSEQAAMADLLTAEQARTAARSDSLSRAFYAIVEGADMSSLDDEDAP